MPRRKGKPNKSQAIREALKAYPDKKPSEIAEMLSQQLGEEVSPKVVYTIKSKEKAKERLATSGAVGGGERTHPDTTGGVAPMVTNLQQYIRRIGKSDLKQLIDTL
ncbi:MAG: hypothetical protein NZ700_12895 [Gemmataceae bacterium]|nr:hypothetical protein [Gemmataceae bacterium]MDW8266321.1 hypothetical protein [Gemmataceae bacterium]